MNRGRGLWSARRTGVLFDQAYLLLTLAVFFWSVNFILGRALRADIPPIGLAFWRWMGATLVLLPFAVGHVLRDWPVIRRHWLIITALATLGVALFNTLVYTGLQWTIALHAFLLQTLMPVLIVLMALFFFGERAGGLQLVGVVLSLAGAVVIIAQGDPAVLRGLHVNRGDLLIFLAVVGYAGYSVLLRKRPAIHPLSLLLVTFALGTLELLPVYLWEALTVRGIRITVASVAVIVYVAIFPSILSYLCFNRGVELVGASRAGLFIHLMPVFGGIMAVLFLGEQLAWYHWAGIALIAAGILLATRPAARERQIVR